MGRINIQARTSNTPENPEGEGRMEVRVKGREIVAYKRGKTEASSFADLTSLRTECMTDTGLLPYLSHLVVTTL